jgi:hypothetical protein
MLVKILNKCEKQWMLKTYLSDIYFGNFVGLIIINLSTIFKSHVDCVIRFLKSRAKNTFVKTQKLLNLLLYIDFYKWFPEISIIKIIKNEL